MPKKTKITGKTRLDKYYHLAKEQGFRSRAAFKLIQLNRKYDFLSGARALLDLCAAPGGWLQVCAKYMPVSSLIVGVDLDPIRSIPNVRTFQNDITTASCRAELKGAFQHWKADVVLNDGSPNVGGAWTKDAYGQAELSLMALKLAVEFLRPGGMFICKVFRSQDSNSLLWVCRQLFNRVEATKPSASRGTSAEIYFVCQGFKAPEKIDPRLLDPSHVFKSIDTAAATINVLRDAPKKQKRHRGGYEDGVMILHKTISATDFLDAPTPAETMGLFNQITFDAPADKVYLNHASTTEDIRVACGDLKVLGRRDFKQLIVWRRAMRAYREQLAKEEAADADAEEDEGDVVPVEETEEERLAREDAELDTAQAKLQAKEKRAKRKRKEQKMKAKTRQLGMIDVDDNGDNVDGLFALDQIKSSAALNTVIDDEDAPIALSSSDDDGGDGSARRRRRSAGSDDSDVDHDLEAELELEDELEAAYEVYQQQRGVVKRNRPTVGLSDDMSAHLLVKTGAENSDDDDDDDDDDSEDEEEKNPLQVDLSNLDNVSDASAKRKAERWFNRDLFEGVGVAAEPVAHKAAPASASSDDDDEEDVEMEDVEEEDETAASVARALDDGSIPRPLVLRPLGKNEGKDVSARNGFEEVPIADSADEWTSDSEAEAEMLAIGKKMLRKEKRLEIEDASYNRFAWQDDALPTWFADDQKQHNRPILPVSKGDIDVMKERLAAINARPIKKIAEARARKKVAAVRRWEKVKSAAEGIAGSKEMPDKEKFKRLDVLYKGKNKTVKKEKQYVVNRKTGSVAPTGPKKSNARTKMVDKRMKADKRGRQAAKRKAKSSGGQKSTQKKRKTG